MNVGIKSYIYLAGSCLAAISAMACTFELVSGQPDYGFPITTGVLTATVLLTVWCYIAAVGAARAKQQGK